MFKISIIISRRDLAAAITLSRFSRVVKSDVETRRPLASVTAIVSVEDIFVSIDAKNNKTISKTIFFLKIKNNAVGKKLVTCNCSRVSRKKAVINF